jgi:hypothetical protein
MHHYSKPYTLVFVPLTLLILLVICSVSAGCGSSSSEQTLTKKEFIARADHICERVRTIVATTAIAYKRKDPSIEEVDLVPKVAVPSIEEEIRRIKALGMPSKDKAGVRAFVSAFENGLAHIMKDPQDVLVAETNPFTKGKAIAANYGLETCSEFP